MRPLWIVTCALSVIGAFFVVLQAAWMLELKPAWLPYVAHPLGALLAGLALGRVAPAAKHTAFVGGLLAVALLALITYALPRAFVLTAARSPHAIVLLPAVAIASGLGCALGPRVSVAASGMWLPAVALLVGACTLQLGGRLAYALGMTADPAALAVYAVVAAVLTGALVQGLVGRACERDVAIGVLVLVLWGFLQQVVLHSRRALTFWDGFMLVGATLGAALGARLARRR